MDELFETTTMCDWTITSSEQTILFNENTLQASPSLLSSATILKKCVLSSFDDEATQWCDFKAYDTTHGMTFWGRVRDALLKEYAAQSFSYATVNTTTGNIRRIISKVCPELHIKTVFFGLKMKKCLLRFEDPSSAPTGAERHCVCNASQSVVDVCS